MSGIGFIITESLPEILREAAERQTHIMVICLIGDPVRSARDVFIPLS